MDLLDGLDDDDVAGWGILLEDLLPPEGEHDDDLVPQMMRNGSVECLRGSLLVKEIIFTHAISEAICKQTVP